MLDERKTTVTLTGSQTSLVFYYPFSTDNRLPIEVISGLQDANWAQHKDTFPITSAKSDSFTGYTKGYSTYAGSFVINCLEEIPLNYLIYRWNEYLDIVKKNPIQSIQDLPPMDCSLISIDNITGTTVVTTIKGLVFIDSNVGMTISGNPTVQTVSWMAKSVSTPILQDRIDQVSELPTSPNYSSPVVSYLTSETEVSTTSTTTTTLGPTTTTTATTLPATTTVVTSTTIATSTLTSQNTLTSADLDRPSVVTQGVVLNSATSNWFDTGIVLNGTEKIEITVAGVTVTSGARTCYSEGYYPGGYPGSFDDSLTMKQENTGSGGWGAPNRKPYSIIAAIQYPIPVRGMTTSIQVNRTFETEFVAGKIWLLFNDHLAGYADNVGTFAVSISVYP